MSTNIRQLKDPVSGDVFYPQTDIAGLVSGGGPGIDAEPTAGSVKPVQSGGVLNLMKIVDSSVNPFTHGRGTIDASGNVTTGSATTYLVTIPNIGYKHVDVVGNNYTTNAILAFYSSETPSSASLITPLVKGTSGKQNVSKEVPEGCKFILVSSLIGASSAYFHYSLYADNLVVTETNLKKAAEELETDIANVSFNGNKKVSDYSIVDTVTSVDGENNIVNESSIAKEIIVINNENVPDGDILEKRDNTLISLTGTVSTSPSNNYTTFFVKNIGYSRIVLYARTPSTISCLVFYSGENPYPINFISKEAGTGSKKTYNVSVPKECELIGICTDNSSLTGTTPFYFNIYTNSPGIKNYLYKYVKSDYTARSLDTFTFSDHTTLNGNKGQAYTSAKFIACTSFINIKDYAIDNKICFNGYSSYNLSLLFYRSAAETVASFIIRYPYSNTKTTFDIPDGANFFRVSLSGDDEGLVVNYPLEDIFIYKKAINSKVELLQRSADAHDERLKELEDTAIAKLNPQTHTALVSAKHKANNYPTAGNNAMLAFLVATDIHGDWVRFERALDYMDDESLVDAMLMLGDACDRPVELRNYDYPSVVMSHSKPVLSIPGNHEVAFSSNNTPLTNAEITSKFYNSEMLEHNGDIHPNDELFWYRDFEHDYYVRENGQDVKHTGHLRVIGLSQIDYNESLERNVEFVISQEQANSLVSTLENTPADYYVVIVSHAAIIRDFGWVNNKFSQTKTGDGNWGTNTVDNNDFFTSIVSAWENGNTVNEQATSGSNTISVNHTFSSSHANKFVCFVAGHTHKDCVVRDKNTNYLQIVITCTSADQRQQGGDLGRGDYGKCQDALTILVYDWFEHRVKLVRAGVDITSNMDDRNYDVVSC